MHMLIGCVRTCLGMRAGGGGSCGFSISGLAPVALSVFICSISSSTFMRIAPLLDMPCEQQVNNK